MILADQAQVAPPALSAPAPDAVPVAAAAPAHVAHAPGDPLENFNRRMFGFHQRLDRAILRPLAMGYKHVVPRFARAGLRHFFANLTEPVVFANFVLQLKPASAIRTVVRFAVNSTVGLAGTIDVAKSKGLGLPHRPNGFGDTLGFYGVKPGPYLFLPLFGPSDLRDFAGAQVDGALLPTVVGKPFDRFDYQVVKTVVTGLDLRAEADADLKALLAGALDPYATLRSVYLQDRAGEIAELKGKPSDLDMPDDLVDPAAAGAADLPPAGPKQGSLPEAASPTAGPAAADSPPPQDGDQADRTTSAKLPVRTPDSPSIDLATGSTSAASSSR